MCDHKYKSILKNKIFLWQTLWFDERIFLNTETKSDKIELKDVFFFNFFSIASPQRSVPYWANWEKNASNWFQGFFKNIWRGNFFVDITNLECLISIFNVGTIKFPGQFLIHQLKNRLGNSFDLYLAIDNNTDRTLDVVFSFTITMRQRPKGGMRMLSLSLFCNLTLPARNSIGLLPQGFCEQEKN